MVHNLLSLETSIDLLDAGATASVWGQSWSGSLAEALITVAVGACRFPAKQKKHIKFFCEQVNLVHFSYLVCRSIKALTTCGCSYPHCRLAAGRTSFGFQFTLYFRMQCFPEAQLVNCPQVTMWYQKTIDVNS